MSKNTTKELLKWATPRNLCGTHPVPKCGPAPVVRLLEAIRATSAGLPEESQWERAAYLLKVIRRNLRRAEAQVPSQVAFACAILRDTVVNVPFYVDADGDSCTCDLNLSEADAA